MVHGPVLALGPGLFCPSLSMSRAIVHGCSGVYSCVSAHLVAQDNWYVCDLVLCVVFDVSNMVRTFHAARRMLVLGPSRLSVILLTSRGLSSEVVIQPVGWLKSAIGSMVVLTFIVVSVTRVFVFYGVELFAPR